MNCLASGKPQRLPLSTTGTRQPHAALRWGHSRTRLWWEAAGAERRGRGSRTSFGFSKRWRRQETSRKCGCSPATRTALCTPRGGSSARWAQALPGPGSGQSRPGGAGSPAGHGTAAAPLHSLATATTSSPCGCRDARRRGEARRGEAGEGVSAVKEQTQDGAFCRLPASAGRAGAERAGRRRRGQQPPPAPRGRSQAGTRWPRRRWQRRGMPSCRAGGQRSLLVPCVFPHSRPAGKTEIIPPGSL